MASHVRLPVMKLPLMKPAVRAAFDCMLGTLSRDPEEAVVIPCRIASAVGVGVAQQQAVPIVGDDHGPQSTVVAREVRDRIARLRAVKRNLP